MDYAMMIIISTFLPLSMSGSTAAVTFCELVGTVKCEEGKAQFLMMSSMLSLTQNGNPYTSKAPLLQPMMSLRRGPAMILSLNAAHGPSQEKDGNYSLILQDQLATASAMGVLLPS